MKNVLKSTIDWIENNHKIAIIFLVTLIVLGFFAYSLQFTGPVYLADELGYLTKAATIAGHPTDTASSYSVGYSLFIAPAFLIFDNAINAWRAIMFINALLWGGVFYILFHILEKLFPKERSYKLILATFACAFYPSWITMSGYAFSNVALVFIFMLCLWLLLTENKKYSWRYVLLGILAGFTCWIHTIGSVFIISLIFIKLAQLFIHRNLKQFLLTFIPMICMVIVYSVFVHRWINDLMTPPGQIAWSHYNGVIKSLFEHNAQLLRMETFWRLFFSMLIGQTAQLLITSFGIIAYAVLAQKNLFKFKKTAIKDFITRILNNKKAVVLIISLISVVGAIIFGSLVLSIHQSKYLPIGSYFIIYGRYSELFILPIIAIGLLVMWETEWNIKIAYYVLLAGSVAYLLAGEESSLVAEQTINISSFWPILIRNSSFMLWFVVGSLGVLIIAYLVRFKGKIMLLLLVPVTFLCIHYQSVFHHKLLNEGSRKSALTTFIKGVYSKNQCIGFEYNTKTPIDEGLDNNRLRLLAYENFTHKFQRMTLEQWKNSCEGPFITSQVHNEKDLKGAQYVAREELSGLLVIARKEDIKRFQEDYSNVDGLYVSGTDPKCVIDGCLVEQANEMKMFSRVGKVVNDELIVNNTEGVLAYGPYTELSKGSYVLEFNAEIINSSNSFIEVQIQSNNDDGDIIYLSDKLITNGKYYFKLNESAKRFQVLITVHKATSAKIRNYKVKRL